MPLPGLNATGFSNPGSFPFLFAGWSGFSCAALSRFCGKGCNGTGRISKIRKPTTSGECFRTNSGICWSGMGYQGTKRRCGIDEEMPEVSVRWKSAVGSQRSEVSGQRSEGRKVGRSEGRKVGR